MEAHEMENFNLEDWITLNEYAKIFNLSRSTSYNHHNRGWLNSIQLNNGRILVSKKNPRKGNYAYKCIVYMCVILNDTIQIEYDDTIVAKINDLGYQVNSVVVETVANKDDFRPKLVKLMVSDDTKTIIMFNKKTFPTNLDAVIETTNSNDKEIIFL